MKRALNNSSMVTQTNLIEFLKGFVPVLGRKSNQIKNVILLSLFSVFILTSCHKEPEPNPYADFGVDYVYVEPGEVVFFNNYSDNADYYEWDFGDGTGSNAFQPSHTYSKEGVYKITLAAIDRGRADYAYLEIEVYETTLEVEVLEYYEEAYVPNMDVAIYRNYNDWLDQNEYYDAQGYTDKNGIVTFIGVDAVSYYVDAWHPNFDNFRLAQEDINFVLTAPLEHARHNIFTAYVDYYADGRIKLKSSRMTVKSAVDDRPKRSAKDKELNRIKERE